MHSLLEDSTFIDFGDPPWGCYNQWITRSRRDLVSSSSMGWRRNHQADDDRAPRDNALNATVPMGVLRPLVRWGRFWLRRAEPAKCITSIS